MEFDAFELLARLYSKVTKQGASYQKATPPSQRMKSFKGKKRIKSSRHEVVLTLSKIKKKVTIDKLVLRPIPFNIIEPSPIYLGQHTSPPLAWFKTPHYTSICVNKNLPSVRHLRKRKGIMIDLTTDIESVAMYSGIALERLDYYMDQIPYMVDSSIPCARMWTSRSCLATFCTRKMLVQPYF